MTESHELTFVRRDARLWLDSEVVNEVWVTEELLQEARTSGSFGPDGVYLDSADVLTFKAANARLKYQMGGTVPGHSDTRAGRLIYRFQVNPESGVTLS